MGRGVRIALAVVIVLIIVVLVLPFLIPVNQFRPTIEEKASAALGRNVTVGNLRVSILSGSLGAENLSIGDDSKFSSASFLAAKSLKVGVELMPLIFSKKLNVTGITIESPQVTLLRNAAGQWNASSLGGSTGKPQQPSTATPDFAVKKLELKDGKIVIGSIGSQKRSTYDHVDITVSDFSMNSAFPVVVTADLPSGGKFKLDGKAGPIDSTDTALTPVDAKLNVGDLNLASTGLLDPSLGLGGVLDLDATLSAQSGMAETKGNAKLSKAVLVAGGSPSTKPVTVDFGTKYDLRKSTGILSPSTIKIGNAAAHLSGTYKIGENAVVDMKVDGQNMPAPDLVTFLPAIGINLPNGAKLASGTLSTNLMVAGPTSKLVTNGNVGLFAAKLTGFDLGSKMSSVASLAGIKSGKDLDIEKLTTNLRIAPDGLKADNFIAVVTNVGSLQGGGMIDAKNNLDFKMTATLTNTVGAAVTPVATAIGMFGKLTGGGSNCKSGLTVPFMIEGTTLDPKFVPDTKGLAAGIFKSQLGGCSNSSSASSSQTTQQKSNPLSGLSGLFGKKK